mmetsp:Transcript_11404/g.30736  ORF Transcript_11404/g.30736 Transcript_11404/m.30736 type:complete len:405 (-) Transcript_11404:241-1455(-)
MTGKFDPRAVLAKLRAGSDSPQRGRGGYSDSQASPGQPPSDPPPLGTSVQPRANHPQTLSRAQAPSDHQKNELLQLVHAKKQLPGGTSVDVERYLTTLEERLRGVERDLGHERAKYSQLLQEHERVEALHVAKEKGDSNKIKDLQAQVARLKEKLLEQQEVAERTKPFDENIVFRSEVPGDDLGDLRIAWHEVEEHVPASPDEILLRRSSSADNRRIPASEPRTRRLTRNEGAPMHALSPSTNGRNAEAAPVSPLERTMRIANYSSAAFTLPIRPNPIAQASVSIDISAGPGPARQRRSQSLRPASASSKSRLYSKTFSAEMRQKADPDTNITVQDLDAYLRKPARGGGVDENSKPAFVSSSSAGRSHRFGAAGRRGSVSIQIPDAGGDEHDPPAININFSDLG